MDALCKADLECGQRPPERLGGTRCDQSPTQPRSGCWSVVPELGFYLHGTHFRLHDVDTRKTFSKFTLKSYHSLNRLKIKQ